MPILGVDHVVRFAKSCVRYAATKSLTKNLILDRPPGVSIGVGTLFVSV